LFFFLVHKEKRNIRGLHLLFVYLKEMRKDTQEGKGREIGRRDDTEEGANIEKVCKGKARDLFIHRFIYVCISTTFYC
jgi:hypothetical protein